MDLRVIIFAIISIFELVNCASLSGKDPPTQNCGGWFGPKCETTKDPTTTTPAPTTQSGFEPCGGLFQKICPPLTTSTAPACGGLFQSACKKTIALTTEQSGSEPCGGLFQKACPLSTTPKPACRGLIQPACEKAFVLTTTPTLQYCGGILGFFQYVCPSSTPAALTQSCGWFSCTDLSTSAPPQGWISSIFSGVYGAVGSVTSNVASITLNLAVDFLLNQVKLFAKLTNMDVVPLPDIDTYLYPGSRFTASGGYFKSLSSISRGDDIMVSRDGLAFIIDFPIVIKDMEIGFNKYKISVLLGLGLSGAIKVGVKENKVNIRIRLAVSTSCAINVEKVDLAVLDGLDIQMNYGCSNCGFLTDKVTNYMVNYLNSTIRGQIQSQIDSILKKTLSDNSLICSKFIGM